MKKRPKYLNTKKEGYDSIHEFNVSQDLKFLQDRGEIGELKEQVKFVLIPGKNGVRGISYIADFTYVDKEGYLHVCDAKAWDKRMQKWRTTAEYRLKEKMMYLLLGITVDKL